MALIHLDNEALHPPVIDHCTDNLPGLLSSGYPCGVELMTTARRRPDRPNGCCQDHQYPDSPTRTAGEATKERGRHHERNDAPTEGESCKDRRPENCSDHGPTVICVRISSINVSEMPWTRARSVISRYGPLATRSSIMRWASTGPMPGKVSSSAFVAVLILIR